MNPIHQSAEDQAIPLAERFFEQDAQMLEQASANPSALDALAHAEASMDPANPYLVLDVHSLAMAVLSEDGEIVGQSAEFEADRIALLVDSKVAENALKDGKAIFQTLPGPPHAICYVPAARLGKWNWPPVIAEAIAGQNRVAVFAERLGQAGVVSRSCRAMGLLPNHSKILEQTIRSGSMRCASKVAGISYQHARATVAEALAIAGCESVHQLISRIASHTFGLLPEDNAPAAELLMEVWGLSPRQSELALLVGYGHSRVAAGRFLKLSEATVKKELNRVYEALEIASVTELAARLAALRLHGLLMQDRTTRGELSELGGDPLTFCHDEDGRRIAFSDYGPQEGRPVFYIHSSMTSRIVPRNMQINLAQHGFRVIAIDRPGFGLTDAVPANQWEVAACDFCLVQKALGLSGGLALARGGAQLLLALARSAPTALDGAVLINPDPRSRQSSKRQGPLGAVKEYFLRSPGMIRTAAGLAARQLSPARVKGWLEKSVASSPADLAAMATPDMPEDYWRAVRSLSTGRVEGYIAEQVEHAIGSDAPLESSPWPFRILFGGQDMLHDPIEAIRYWKTLIPGVETRLIVDAGRLLSFSHLSLVVDELTILTSLPGKRTRPFPVQALKPRPKRLGAVLS